MAKKISSKQSPTAEVIGLGGAFLDLVCPVSEEFVANLPDGSGKGTTVHCTWEGFQALLSQLPAADVRRRCGGGVGTTLRRLSQRGIQTLMLTAVGDDEEGRTFLERLKADGVDTSRVRVIPGEHTGICISLVTPDGERTMRTYRGINDNLGKYVTLRKSDLEGALVLYTEGYLLSEEEFVQKSLALSKEMGVDVIFDVGSSNMVIDHQKFFRNVLPSYASVVLANSDEATALTGTPDPMQAVLLMNQFYGLSIVKCGGDGATYVDENATPQLEPVPKESNKFLKAMKEANRRIDTTGAGDAWATGFVFSYLNDNPIQIAVSQGNVEACLHLMENSLDNLAQEQLTSIKH